MEIRKILTETETREWFNQFGDPKKGLTFKNIFGDMDIQSNNEWTYRVYMNILFVKIRVEYYDTFGCTPSVDSLDRYMILPQVDMNLL